MLFQLDEMLRELASLRLAIDSFGEAGQVVLSVGVLDVGQQLRLMVHEVHPARQ